MDIQSKNHPDNTDLIDGETLLKRAETLPVKAERRQAIERWIRITAEDIG
ncbi:MAG: hypothetical protein Q7J82_09480 [Coriobacteriia bacterium]|nr:hypothetical protein [Coriobacteriia bacterium]